MFTPTNSNAIVTDGICLLLTLLLKVLVEWHLYSFKTQKTGSLLYCNNVNRIFGEIIGMLGNTNKYSFWWNPKPVTNRRSTRAQKGTPTEPYRNVMYDKRIVRGSNYGATSILAELDTYDKATEWRRRNALRKKVLTRNQRNVIGTPPPVMGRRHEVIQTEKYLEELLEHPPVRTIDTQTDLFLELPPTPPPFVPSKIGTDVGTHIEPGDLTPRSSVGVDDDELPLIESFIEACITDTAQEVELETARAVYENSITQTTSSNLLQSHVAEVLPDVLDASTREELKDSLCPWLSDHVDEEVAQIVDSHEILTVIIEEIIKQRGETYAAFIEEKTETAISYEAKESHNSS